MPCVIGAPALPARVRTYALYSVSLILVLAAALAGRATWGRYKGGGRSDGRKPQRAFYYWKTQWSGSPVLARSLADNRATRLYMRFFDIDWDEPARAALPVAPLQLGAPLPSGVELVPVVYIANRVFLNTPDAEVGALADRAWLKLRKMAEASAIPLREVQLDCDWSDGTRRRYFHFVERFGRELHRRKLQVSATIRLHQVKYAARTGVPPVDRGMAHRNISDSQPLTLDMKLAEKYYKRAMELAADKELKAKACFMAAKTEQNRYFNAAAKNAGSAPVQHEPVHSPVYFKLLKSSYANTRYYQEIIRECGYFRSYLKR